MPHGNIIATFFYLIAVLECAAVDVSTQLMKHSHGRSARRL